MDQLRQWLGHIGAQLSVLTVSQRLAIGLCAALAAGSFLWLLQWSTTPELTPLITRDFTYEDLDAAEQALRSNGIGFESRGTRIYVRPTDRYNAVRVLHSADALPEGSLFDMEAVVSDTNPFQSPQARAYAQNFAKGNELAKIIATSPAVKSASVIINPVTKRRLGGASDVPTASVTVTLASNKEMTHEIVEGFAKLVAGGVAGLKPHQVNITDARTMRSYGLPDPEDAASFDLLGMIKAREEHYRAKILSKLADIPGVQVAVTVELDTSKRVTQNLKHNPPQPKTETSDTSEQTADAQAVEPGVQPNLGQALTAAGPGPSQTTEKTSVEMFAPQLSQTETIEQMPFAAKKVTAAVGIPRSFVIGVFKAQHPDVTDGPNDDDPDFVAVRDAQVARIRASIEKIVMTDDPDDVEVDVYPDMEWTADGGEWSRAPGGVARVQHGEEGLDAAGLVRTYGPQLGLGTLALMSLFMMMRVVRKSSQTIGPRKQRLHETETPPEDEPLLTVGPQPVGQAKVSESMLTGKEVDANTLRYQELAQEVSKMVEDDPDGTADLIRRWTEET
jgi:flagellar biosynthesis/type III secretory pathway M-ring protein FliF/YscJ